MSPRGRPGDRRRDHPHAAARAFSLDDLVANGSISAAGAEVLRTVAHSGRSFLVHARPRNAGKSTLTNAILAEAPASLPRPEFFGTEDELAALSAVPAVGYLSVAEIGHRGRPGYLAAEEVVRLFALVAHGYSVASSLHADSVDEVFDVLASNGIGRDQAATVPYLVKIRVLGDPDDDSATRVVEAIHETGISATGEVTDALLYQWDGRAPAVGRS